MEDTNKLQTIRKLLENAESSILSAHKLLNESLGAVPQSDTDILQAAKEAGSMVVEDNTRIINGLFDGQHMIGPDGKQYSVPANYASKSKLVEGDMLKLTITPDGSFVYKQVGPIDRNRIVGNLMYDSETEEWKVSSAGKLYHVLLASVTYFKGELGDEVVLLVPKDKEATWGAVENIIKAGTESPKIEIGPVTPEVPVEKTGSDLDEL